MNTRKLKSIGFNGAATFRLRKVCTGRGLNSTNKSFNGAATFRLRKAADSAKVKKILLRASMGPQPFGCGRKSWAMQNFLDGGASMGPQPFGCGRLYTLNRARRANECFNGAATFRLRKGQSVPPLTGRPHCFNGAATFRLRKACHAGKLAARDRGFNGAATFRLRKVGLRGPLRSPLRASMGPQPFGCGRARADLRILRQVALQWGRNLSVAEGRYLIAETTGEKKLQWGRNLSVAEGWGRTRRTEPQHGASMGPQPFGCGRTRVGA